MLDEATGARDARSESGILSALRSRLPQTALVVVSHRTGLAAIPDQCLVMDGWGVATAVRRDDSDPAPGPASLKPGMRAGPTQIGSGDVGTPVTNAPVVCRRQLTRNNTRQTRPTCTKTTSGKIN